MKWSLLVYLALLSFCIQAQNPDSVCIRIVNFQGRPLVGVNAWDEKNEIGTISDIQGIIKWPMSSDSLNLSYLGFMDTIIARPRISFTDIKLVRNMQVLACPIIRANYTPPLLSVDKLIVGDLNTVSHPNISNILNRSTDVFMHSGAYNTNRITIRGIGNRSPFSTNKLRAYIDEIPVTNGVGETSIEDLDLSMFSSLNIWKGPTSSVFGASLGGMIEFKTALNGVDQNSRVSNRLVLGEYGLVSNSSSVHFSNKNRDWSGSASFGHHRSDGYRDNNNYQRLNYGLQLRKFGDRSSVRLLMQHINLRAQIPSSLNEIDYNESPKKAAFTWQQVEGYEDYTKTILGVSYDKGLLNNWRIKSSVFANLYNAYESRPFNILDDEAYSFGGRLRLLWDREDEIGWFASIGSEFFDENYDWSIFETQDGIQGEKTNENSENRRYLNLFADINYKPWSEIIIQAGINVNHTSYTLVDGFNGDDQNISGDHSFGTILSPRLSIHYVPRKWIKNTSLVSHGFSAPSLEETLNPDGEINTELKPEQGWNLENITELTFLEKSLKVELDIYTMNVQDLIITKRLDLERFIGDNAGQTRHSGIGISLEHNLLERREGRSLSYHISYNYARYRFLDFVDDGNDFSGNELTGTSPNQIFGEFNGAIGPWFGKVDYRFRDEMPLRDDNSIYSDKYHLSTIQIGFKKLLFENLSLKIFGGINNWWNEKYASMFLINASSFGGASPRYYYPGLPRNYFLGIDLSLSFDN